MTEQPAKPDHPRMADYLGRAAPALRAAGKKAIAIDLNPFSRTAQSAHITIVDNVTRAAGLLADEAGALAGRDAAHLEGIVSTYDNGGCLAGSIALMMKNLSGRAKVAQDR